MSAPLDRDAVLAFILAWIEKDKGLPKSSLSPDTTFDDLGLDSLARMTLAGEIYDTFACEFEASVMWDCKTPEAVVEALGKQGPVVSITTLSEGAPPHIVLIFGLGGTARDLYPIADGMKQAGAFSVSALEQPFSEDARVDTAEDTIQFISDAIIERFGGEPVIPFGYSFGGLLAMGVADALRSKGSAVPLTGLLDTNHPDAVHDRVGRAMRLATLMRHLPGWVSERILRAPPGQRRPGMRAIRRELRHFSGALRGGPTPRLKDVIRKNGRPPAWDARTEQNFNILNEYCPTTHGGDLLLLRAKTRPLDGSLNHARNGWDSVVKGDIHVLEMRGTHATLLDTAHLHEAGRLLASALRAPELAGAKD